MFAPRLLRGGGGSLTATSDPDSALVRACQEYGPDESHEEFRELYERHKNSVYETCLRMTGNDADALDAAQDTFRTVYDRMDRFHFRSRFSTWLGRIAAYTSLDVRARTRRRAMRSLDALIDGVAWAAREPSDPKTEGPLWSAARREQEEAIREALERLSTKYRAVIALRYLEGLSYGEIAEELGISLGTVKSRMARAHKALDRDSGGVLRRQLG